MLRFGYGNCVPVSRVNKATKVVTTAEPLLEASTGYSILLSRVAYTSVVGTCLQITVAGTVATVIHDGSLTSVVLGYGKACYSERRGTLQWRLDHHICRRKHLYFQRAIWYKRLYERVWGHWSYGVQYMRLSGSNRVLCTEDWEVSAAVAIHYENYEGVGGSAAYVPASSSATATARLTKVVDRVEPSIDGFLHNAYSTSNMSSAGTPRRSSFQVGETASDVFNTITDASAVSTVLNGSIVSGTTSSRRFWTGKRLKLSWVALKLLDSFA